jgi:hypothetical protein
MIRFLRKCFTDFHQWHIDMSEVGIWYVPTAYGIFTYTDLKSKDNNENEEKNID